MTAEDKVKLYESLYPELEGLIDPAIHWRGNWSNAVALLHERLGNWWTGFYFIRNGQLELDMFQGPVACTRIGYGKGVCGKAWEMGETMVVENVHDFPGHIACSAESNSEIVVPVFRAGKIVAVLDCDSRNYGAYDKTDALWLKKIVLLLAGILPEIEPG